MYKFGKTVTHTISSGDFIKYCYLEIQLPSLSVPDYEKIADEEYPQTTLYNRCIKKIAYDLEYNISQLLEELYNDIKRYRHLANIVRCIGEAYI